MQQTGQLVAERAAGVEGDMGPLGHPRLHLFDEVRPLFASTGLPPEPDNYELLYLHVSGADPTLSREVERALAAGELGPIQVQALRKAHLGDIAAAELQLLVEAAQGSAQALAALEQELQAQLQPAQGKPVEAAFNWKDIAAQR